MNEMRFRLGFKRSIVKKHVKKYFRRGWLFLTMEGRKIIKDLHFLPEEVLDVLLISQPKTVVEFEKMVNAHISLNLAEQNLKQEVMYSIGEASKFFTYVDSKEDSRNEDF